MKGLILTLLPLMLLSGCAQIACNHRSDKGGPYDNPWLSEQECERQVSQALDKNRKGKRSAEDKATQEALDASLKEALKKSH